MGFNSREYEWADLSFVLGGTDITHFRGLKYSEKIEREALFAKGRHAIAIQSGNVTVEGEVTLLQSQYEALVKAGKGSVLSIVVDGLASYGNPSEGTPMTTDRITNIHFTEAGKEFKQGDKFQEITLPFIATKLDNQI